MKIVVDLDGTICPLKKPGQDYSELAPLPGAVEKMRMLKEAWHLIILQTARHMETCQSNLGAVNARIAKKTLDWLEKYSIPYDEIYFGKPNADIYIDDNAKTFLGWDDVSDVTGFSNDVIDVVIPMAGAGSRFVKAGYEKPKPLIDVLGKPMLSWATDSFQFLEPEWKVRFIFVILNEHIEKWGIDRHIREVYPGCEIVVLEKMTRGQAETALAARDHINGYSRLIIYNADTYSNYDLSDFPISDKTIDGLIPCFESDDPRYSYASCDEKGWVSEVAEKKVISNHATNGLYYFRRGNDFVRFAEKMIARGETSNGEFYVGPLYNDLVRAGKRVKICGMKDYAVLGTPEELEAFLKERT